ncbi:fam-m protein [Plasmodium malariae]|uniref:Fam-m protein n=1 Tax=Plasmodium malariae TaxID=5858 RepID=A0A1D3JI91_PLAMA|nr:fam-m protein [Plasmodium malariae]SBT86002.1 fam-m protein [Plasmodium malariae]
MEKKIKLHITVKIVKFLLLTWIWYFDNNLSIFRKSLDEYCCSSKKLDTRYYRSLAKYKLDSGSNNVCLKGTFPNNRLNEKRNIYGNEEEGKGKNEESNRGLFNKAQYYTEVIDYNKGIFDGKHFHFERKWIKKKDYDYFLEKRRRICDIGLKKVKFRSYGFGVFLFVLFFLLGIGIPLLPKLSFLENTWKLIEESTLLKEICNNIKTFMKEKQPYLYSILFIVLMIMVSIMFLVGIYKILRNNEKYNKIKLIAE